MSDETMTTGQHKVAIVTGGGSGIGRSVAIAFGRHNYLCVVADVDLDAARSVADELSASGAKALAIQVDVTDEPSIANLVEVCRVSYGGVDILFNGAGILRQGTVETTEKRDWDQVIGVNLTGTYLMSRAVIPFMRARGGGSIVNASSSTGAHDAIGGLAAYVASKGGVTLLTKAMAIDHAPDNIRVNAVAPGPTDTPMLRAAVADDEIAQFAASFPLGRLGTPDEIAAVVAFLASDAASFVTGSIVAADGGQTAAI